MAPTSTRKDPYRKFNFIVEIDGIASSNFLTVEGIESLTEVVEYREGNEVDTPRKLPGYQTASNIILRRGMNGNKDLWLWRKTVLDGQADRRSGSIVILDEKRVQVARVNFREAWPCRWKLGGLDALANQTLLEEVELVVEDLQLETV